MKEVVEFIKNFWGVVSALSVFFGPIGTTLIPIVPKYRTSCMAWASISSVLALVITFRTLWRKRDFKPRLCVPCIVAAVVCFALYAYLLDWLPHTPVPREYETLTGLILSLPYGVGFGLLTAAFSLAVKRS